MKSLILTIAFTLSNFAFAKDCSTVKPFKQIGSQKAHVTVVRIFWATSGQDQEDVCSGDLVVSAYNVRGREDDAYYCLKPKESEVLTCKTLLDGTPATISVIPATWIRNWKLSDVREYRFHSYINKNDTPDFFLDVFSRVLQSKLSAQSLIIEGALKTGPSNRNDGYFIRAEFRK